VDAARPRCVGVAVHDAVGADLSLEVWHAVTFFVGENGSGKSTLVEGLRRRVGSRSPAAACTSFPTGTAPRRRARSVARCGRDPRAAAR
jgi:ABC-type multidrug transport system ATPase subunit